MHTKTLFMSMYFMKILLLYSWISLYPSTKKIRGSPLIESLMSCLKSSVISFIIISVFVSEVTVPYLVVLLLIRPFYNYYI